LDYTAPLANVIMEYESGAAGLTYRYAYGLDKNSVTVHGITEGSGSVAQYVCDDGAGGFVLAGEGSGGNLLKDRAVKLYYHQDRLGSASFLTSNTDGRVISYVSYDDWGAPTMKAVLKTGARELDLATEYTGHPYDPLLGAYYARARMYDAADRRFMAMDPVNGNADKPNSFNAYAYCLNNSLVFVDPLGLWDEDVHKQDTKAWAKDSRFSEEDAEIIANACNNVDSGASRFAMDRHFNTASSGDSRTSNYNIRKVAALMEINKSYDEIERGCKDRALYYRRSALEQFGIGLHSAQDKFAHGDSPLPYITIDGHFAYHATDYFNKPVCRGYTEYFIASDGNYDLFDNRDYDITLEKRNIRFLARSGWQIAMREVYIATPGSTRYSSTETDSKRKLTWFYEQIERLDNELNRM